MTSQTIGNEKARFDTRLPLELKLLFEKAAALGGFRSLTDFIISAVREKASEIIMKNETVLSSENDSRIFFDAMMNPKNPNKELVSASEKYKTLVSE